MAEVRQQPPERTDSLRALAALLEYARDEARALGLPFLLRLLTMARVEVARDFPNGPDYEPIIFDPDDAVASCEEEQLGRQFDP